MFLEFQFLIGSLEAVYAFHYCFCLWQFQFLIGSLEAKFDVDFECDIGIGFNSS